MSAGTVTAPGRSAATRSSSPARRASRLTVAPSAASKRAVDSPMPELAPVTSARRPASRPASAMTHPAASERNRDDRGQRGDRRAGARGAGQRDDVAGRELDPGRPGTHLALQGQMARTGLEPQRLEREIPYRGAHLHLLTSVPTRLTMSRAA